MDKVSARELLVGSHHPLGQTPLRVKKPPSE